MISVRHGGSAAVVCLCLTTWMGCSAKPTLEIRKLLVDVSPGAEGPGAVLARDALRSMVERRLGSHPQIQVVPGDPEAAVLRVRLESTTGTVDEKQGSAPWTHGSVHLVVEASGGGAQTRWSFHGQGAARANAPVNFGMLVEEALDTGLQQVLLAKSAHQQPSDTLLAWLASNTTGRDQRLQAVRLLGARREPQATPLLVDLLGDDDAEVAQAAMGAIMLIGDPRAVSAVIQYAEAKPSLVRRQAIEAVRNMGTYLGKAWLFTLSTGHPDQEVQQAAASALAQLEQTTPARAATTDSATRLN